MAVFTASCDDVDTNTRFAKELMLDFPILSDPTAKTAGDYGLVRVGGKTSSRTTVYVGANGKILFIDTSVKTSSHGEDIAAKLKELGVEETK